ncbi:DUF4169 family protein [Sulfitobacter aestuariivivens]|uniref:DUF4169 family protein n=1 Tax=Sulfitobacter aestuariivivens TaxID=2766981 RepID=A0A927D5U0_9RHOB|nr:DUF4169 family protein [Sulfitobacter aestuariivivens]
MSEKPINLNKARKTRARAARCKQADENAIKFGQSKAEKATDKSDAERVMRHLDGHKRET